MQSKEVNVTSFKNIEFLSFNETLRLNPFLLQQMMMFEQAIEIPNSFP